MSMVGPGWKSLIINKMRRIDKKLTRFPLRDGDAITYTDAGTERVAGSVYGNPTICYVNGGWWFRRKDGMPMTRHRGEFVTVQKFFKLTR